MIAQILCAIVISILRMGDISFLQNDVIYCVCDAM